MLFHLFLLLAVIYLAMNVFPAIFALLMALVGILILIFLAPLRALIWICERSSERRRLHRQKHGYGWPERLWIRN